QGKFNVVVEVGDKTAASFTQADQRKVRDLLVKNFDAKKYDEGLVSGLEYIRDTLNVNPPPRVAEQKGGGAAGGAAGGGAGGGGRRAADEPANFWSTPVGWVCIGLLVLLGLWLIMRVLGAIFAPRPAYGAPGAG